jgi:hypothetical protein
VTEIKTEPAASGVHVAGGEKTNLPAISVGLGEKYVAATE